MSSKLRICHLASGDLWAGAEVQIANMCRGLRDSGEVEVSAIVLNDGRLAEEIRHSGSDVAVLDEQMTSCWQILWQLARHFQKLPVDILHTHRYKENVLGGLAARIAGVPNIVRTVHGMPEMYSGRKWMKSHIYEALDNLATRYWVDALIGVSREIFHDLERRFPNKVITSIPNCVDPKRLVITKSREEKRAELGLKPSEFVIGTAGRLTRVKGIEYLIRAVAELVNCVEGIRVLVIGDGPLRADLENLSRELALEKTIVFLGFRDDCIDLIHTLDLFVLPSLHEGMPTVLLEAMALGVPVVASATGGIPEVIVDGWNGLLAKPANPLNVAEKCLHICFDSFLANQLAENARSDLDRYYLKQASTDLVALYRQIHNGF